MTLSAFDIGPGLNCRSSLNKYSDFMFLDVYFITFVFCFLFKKPICFGTVV